MTNESIRTMARFTEILKNNPGHAYDFISTNYYKFSKEELTNIVKELLYGIYDCVTVAQTEHNEILDNVAIELDEQYEEYYQEIEA